MVGSPENHPKIEKETHLNQTYMFGVPSEFSGVYRFLVVFGRFSRQLIRKTAITRSWYAHRIFSGPGAQGLRTCGMTKYAYHFLFQLLMEELMPTYNSGFSRCLFLALPTAF